MELDENTANRKFLLRNILRHLSDPEQVGDCRALKRPPWRSRSFMTQSERNHPLMAALGDALEV